MFYIIALDISLKNTGVAVFEDTGTCVYTMSIPTLEKWPRHRRLKFIYDALLNLRDIFPCQSIVMERGFSRFNIATQVLFRVHGVVNLAFWDCAQTYYSIKEIRMELGCTTGDKAVVGERVRALCPHVTPTNDDETDAMAAGLCYFSKRDNHVV
jgi:Holliday junction resolvasome RuvABC endonuclease subunit